MQSSASWASYMLALAEMHVIGGDQRQLLGIGHVQQRVLGGALFRQAMTLQFDIEPVGESRRQRVQRRFGRLALAIQQTAG